MKQISELARLGSVAAADLRSYRCKALSTMSRQRRRCKLLFEIPPADIVSCNIQRQTLTDYVVTLQYTNSRCLRRRKDDGKQENAN